MPSRSRTSYGKPMVGQRGFRGLSQTIVTLTPFHTCDDVVGNPTGENLLNIEHFTASAGEINTSNLIGSTYYDWIKVPAFPLASAVTMSTDTQSNASILARALGTTGPLTPRVNLPLFVYELKDLPGMLKDAGDFLHGLKRTPFSKLNDRELASWTLAYQFGWGPLVGDLVKMSNFVDTVKKRQAELKKASSSKGLKRRITLDPGGGTISEMKVANSAGGLNITVPCLTTMVVQQWATVRWKIVDGQNIGKEPSFGEAFKAAYGLNPGMIPIDVWKALPWSWAADWFLDISNMMQASYNMIYYQPSRVCIMTTKTSTMSFPQWPGTGEPRMTAGTRTRVIKSRTVASPTLRPRLKLPYLDNFKLSILGSFTVLRIRGRQRR